MHFWPKNGNFRQLGPYNGLPSSRMGTYQRYPELPQDMGCYDSVESSPSETKKGGLYGSSVTKNWFSGHFLAQKRALTPPRRPPCNAVNTKRLSFRCPVMRVTIFFEAVHEKLIFGRKHHFWAQKGPFWAIGAMKRPAERPNGHLPENRSYPEDVGVLWSHTVGSVWPQKMGVIWV